MTPVTAAAVIHDGLDDAQAVQPETPAEKHGRALQAITDLSRRARFVLLPMAAGAALTAAVGVIKPTSALAQTYTIATEATDEVAEPRIMLAAAMMPVQAPTRPQPIAPVETATLQLAAATTTTVKEAEKPRPMYTVQPAYVMADDAGREIDYRNDPGYADFEKRFGIPLLTQVTAIQEGINRDRGAVVKEVQMRFVRFSPLKNADGSYSWGKVINGLGDAKLAPPAPLATLYAGTADPYQQVVKLIQAVADEWNPQNFAWRKDLTPEQSAEYRKWMATVRTSVLGQMDRLPPYWQKAVSAKMMEVLANLEQQMGQSAPRGFWYRVVVTGRLDRFVELQLVSEMLGKMPDNHQDRPAYETRRNELLGSVRQFGDLSNLLVRALGEPGAMSIRPDMLLPDPNGGDKSVTIGHFAGFREYQEKNPGRGIPMSATQGYVTDAGIARLSERLPMLAGAFKLQGVRQRGLISDTIGELPKNVAALNAWATPRLQWIIHGNLVGAKLTDTTRPLISYIGDIQAGRKPKLDAKTVQALLVEGKGYIPKLEETLAVLGDEKLSADLPVWADASAQSIASLRSGIYDKEGGVAARIKSMRWVLKHLDPDNKIVAAL